MGVSENDRPTRRTRRREEGENVESITYPFTVGNNNESTLGQVWRMYVCFAVGFTWCMGPIMVWVLLRA